MSLRYTVGEGLSGIWRQKLSAFGSILTITISLLLLGVYFLVSVQASRMIQQVRANVDMEVFLKDPITKDKLITVQTQIQDIEGIVKAEFVSKPEAAERFKEEFGEDINNVLDFNPLPASFKITLSDASRTAERAEAIQKKLLALKGIDDVVYRKDMMAFLDTRTQTLNRIALMVGVFLAVVALILISNSIRLTIVSRKEAIRIMKLVGATQWFIRAPFIIEGIALGILGGTFASGILFYLISSAKDFLPTELGTIVNVTISFYLLTIGIGTMLGIAGSTVSAWKYIGESAV